MFPLALTFCLYGKYEFYGRQFPVIRLHAPNYFPASLLLSLRTKSDICSACEMLQSSYGNNLTPPAFCSFH